MATNWQEFWGTGGTAKARNDAMRDTARADYERRQRGEGERPWWISERDWRKRQSEWNFQQAQADAPKFEDFQDQWETKWKPRFEALRSTVYDADGNYLGTKAKPTADINK